MPVEIKNRYTGKVIRTVDADTLINVNLEDANLEGAYLRGADLRDAYLRDANLEGADLGDAYLRGAYLRDANLRDADLGDANLEGADLGGANLRGANLVADLGQRSDGYQFYVQWKDGNIWILAGCRYMPIKEAAQHWKDTRAGTALGDETTEMLRRARWVAKHRGWAA